MDASALVRFYKCDALGLLATSVRVVLAGQVSREFNKRPQQRARLDQLNPEMRPVRVGSTADAHLGRLRGARASTRDLGEDETIAIGLDARDRGETLPLVVFDARAGRDARDEGLVTLDFVDTMAWLVGCAVTNADDADDLMRRAGVIDGWVPPAGYSGSIEGVRAERQARFLAAFSSSRS